jgi:hypothetical protein
LNKRPNIKCGLETAQTWIGSIKGNVKRKHFPEMQGEMILVIEPLAPTMIIGCARAPMPFFSQTMISKAAPAPQFWRTHPSPVTKITSRMSRLPIEFA